LLEESVSRREKGHNLFPHHMAEVPVVQRDSPGNVGRLVLLFPNRVVACGVAEEFVGTCGRLAASVRPRQYTDQVRLPPFVFLKKA
jgi:hypothetical protein